jgi:hypothetical protein
MEIRTNWRLKQPLMKCTKCGHRDGWKPKFVFAVCASCGHVRTNKDYKAWKQENGLA